MKTANLAGAVLGTILKVVFVVVVIYLVYTGASTCYDYGYRIFTEPAVSAGDRKSTRLNSSHYQQSRMPSSA